MPYPLFKLNGLSLSNKLTMLWTTFSVGSIMWRPWTLNYWKHHMPIRYVHVWIRNNEILIYLRDVHLSWTGDGVWFSLDFVHSEALMEIKLLSLASDIGRKTSRKHFMPYKHIYIKNSVANTCLRKKIPLTNIFLTRKKIITPTP